MLKDWSYLFERMFELLVLMMVKDYLNLFVVKEEGCYYYGLDGKEYFDFISGIVMINVGYRYLKVVKVIKDGVD